MDKLAPDGDPGFIHTLEGDDDMSSHIKMALTRSAEVLPFKDGHLLLGTWQGIFLWEHRLRPHQRQLVLTFHGE
jgi:secondary thiamine-phosphate synthase enzyme